MFSSDDNGDKLYIASVVVLKPVLVSTLSVALRVMNLAST
jgi:hypothetical protein